MGLNTPCPGKLESIVGSSYSGVLSCDDFTAYNGYAVTAQQKCQAHLPSPVTSRH
jgi:transposase